MGAPVSKVCDVRLTGPLAPFAADFRAGLLERGYTPLTVVSVMRLAAHLSRWLEASGLAVADLTGDQVERYVRERRAAGYTAFGSRRGLSSLLAVLAALAVLPADPPAGPLHADDALLASFEQYLLNERALAASTTAAYLARARRFLSGRPGRSLADLRAGDVTAAVLAESSAVSAGSAQYFVAALRAFLRFCFLEGLTGTDLAGAALAVTGRRRSLLPQGIAAADAEALVASCDRSRPDGRRDYAVLLSLLRLGLRASEVAGLLLDDIDWRAGEVTVHGKGQRDDRLPLPADVGEAIAGYLSGGRPATARREVFLRALAPVGPLGRGAVSSIVRRACARSGIPPAGAHRLRHTVACQMLAAGVPLTEIGQVLRHRAISSTASYARVDLAALRELAQPWPGGPQR
jgi:site-specific recombinase XerD